MRKVWVLLAIVTALLLSPTALAEKQTIKIGVLVDLSGDLSTYGNDIKDTLSIAKDKINEYFEEKGLPYQVEFVVEDTQINPTRALELTQELYSKGIKLIVGPMGSGEVANIKGFVTNNKIIIISPSSTALPQIIGFAKPEDKKYIFRFVGTDDLQTDAITGELKDLGIKAVVIVYRDNAWGRGLYECIKPKLENEGIEIGEVIPYPDQIPTDWSTHIASAENAVNDLLKKYNTKEVAIVAFSYEEIFTMMAQADQNSVLFKVLWFGCDGTAKSDKISDVCGKVEKVGMYSTLFSSKGKAYEELVEEYQKRGFGEHPYQYALNAYDAAWVLALSYVEVINKTGSYDPDVMAETIPVVTEKYSNGEYGVYPVSGYIKLNEWNDRASGDYAIWYVNDQCEWDLAGIWKFETKTIEWMHKPSAPVVTEETTTATVATTEKTPGFEGVLAVAGLLAVVYAIRRRA
ncbi:ABC transporter substrate-binding protein [Archaeoglobus profundus]|nr:ABC transporter substrate-binding protein [Archaeoglobus profundus]